MKRMLAHWVKDERGVTALETAIILIAFVVVAAVFAFTILSTGTFMTERSKEAAFSGLSQVRGSIELKGSVIANVTDPAAAEEVDSIVFTLSNVSGGEPVDFTAPISGTNVVNIDYRDKDQTKQITDWTVNKIIKSNDNNLLEGRELFEITVPLSSLTTALGINTTFAIEIKPPAGATLVVERTTPAAMEKVNDLK